LVKRKALVAIQPGLFCVQEIMGRCIAACRDTGPAIEALLVSPASASSSASCASAATADAATTPRTATATAASTVTGTSPPAVASGRTIRLDPAGRSVGLEALVSLLARLPSLFCPAEIPGSGLDICRLAFSWLVHALPASLRGWFVDPPFAGGKDLVPSGSSLAASAAAGSC
jgi:hypothetical protein